MRPCLAVAFVLLAAPALAEVPVVLTDTAPVHSLVASVMGDLGSPSLIVPQGTSPHDASLTPTEAQALTEADLVIWTGNAFLPWLGDAISSLAPGKLTVALLETTGWQPLPLRAGANLDDDHAENERVQGQIDPHAWLDPTVAAAWLVHIAEALAAADPVNADAYRANASAAAERLIALRIDMVTRLAPFADRNYAVGHDAYQYFERATGLPAIWAIAQAEGTEPSPGTAMELRAAVLRGEIQCLLIDSEIDPGWAGTLGEGAALRTAQADPEGIFLELGPDLYPTLMENLTAALETCLAP